MKKKKKGLLIFVILLLLAAVIGFIVWYVMNQDKIINSGTDTVFVDSVGTITGLTNNGTNQRYAGVVEAQETWNVENSSDKTVSEIYVEEGDIVNVGDPLFVYDTTDSEENLVEGEIEIDRLNAEIENYEAQIKTLQADKAKAGSDEQLDYQTQIQTIQNSLKKSQYDLQKQQVENENLQKSINNATVYSELAGLVQSINKNSNESAYSYDDSSNYFMTIVAVGQYRVKVTINEQNRYDLTEGASVLAYSRVVEGQYWRGTLESIDYDNPVSDNSSSYYYYGSSSDSSTTSSSYYGYITLEDDTDLIMGQHVYVEMDYGQEDGKEGLWLSSYYIVQNDGEDPYVWAVNDKDKIEKRTVTLGEYDEDLGEYEITDGLSASDYIAFPSEYVQEGADADKNVDSSASYYSEYSEYSDDSDILNYYYEEDTEDAEYGYTDDTDNSDEEIDTEDGVWTDGDDSDLTDALDGLDIEEYTDDNIGDGSAPASAETEG